MRPVSTRFVELKTAWFDRETGVSASPDCAAPPITVTAPKQTFAPAANAAATVCLAIGSSSYTGLVESVRSLSHLILRCLE
jgi:hypothetical protein